jgi:serine phosphatase RsbU (regulator of sigma subunit)/pSer/pThr/pTyr-binding forkhead associated (FHA) protein
MAFLKVIDGSDKGQLRELKGTKAVIGRHPDCDIEVTVAAASRHHAQIVCVGDDYFLEDLHSRNGTFLNDEQIRSRTKLSEGDLIRVTESVFSFHAGEENGEPAGAGKPPIVRTFMVDDDEESTPSRVFLSRIDAPSSASDASGLSLEVLQYQLEALSEFTQRAQRVLELEKLLPEILDGLFSIYKRAERGFIILENDEGEFRTRWAKLRSDLPDDAIPVSRTIIKQVMETQQAILSADAADDERFADSKSLVTVPIRAMMCAPLIDKEGKSFGVIQIDTVGERDRFREHDLRLLCTVSAQASLAIENARLHEEVMRQRALERDLELAREIQRSFIPKDSPELPGFAFFDYYQPANHVGGDFFDYVGMPDGRLGIVVADVVGHGVAAAMLTAKLAADVRFGLLSTQRPVDAVARLNATLSRDLLEDHFVTLVLAVLTPHSGKLTIVNAGHVPPLHGTPDGRVVDVAVEESGWPLGVDPNTVYGQCEIELEPGDILALYTDGVNESLNLTGEMYGIDRIRKHIRAAPSDVVKLGHGIIDDIHKYVRGSAQGDDMCLICCARQ